jgi:hypothetical protein
MLGGGNLTTRLSPITGSHKAPEVEQHKTGEAGYQDSEFGLL